MSPQADFFVAPSGRDDGPGTRSDPFVSLSRARDAVRELKKKGETRDITVLIRGGNYRLEETVVFTLEDSAAEGHKVTYAAYPGEKPVFSSGLQISGWRELGRERPEGLTSFAKAHVWVADLPEELGRFYTLYDGDKRLPRACSDGFIPSGPRLPWDYLYQKDLEPFSVFGFPQGAVKAWDNIEDVDLVIRCQVFTMSILPLESVDEEKCCARTAVPGAYPLRGLRRLGGWEKSAWIENTLEALTKPGEWVLNTKTRKLYLWPTGDDPGDEICAPSLLEFIRVEGDIDFDGSVDKPARGIVFSGLTFTQGDRKTTAIDDVAIQHDWEMLDRGDALVRLRGTEDCAVSDCTFLNSGSSAVRLDLHSQKNSVTGNHIHHLGGAGIALIGYGPGTKDVNRQNEVINNHIHHCGEIYWHSHGIILWQSGENRVVNNCIHHMPRKGICLGGVRPWFFDPDRGTIRECTGSIRWHEIDNPEAAKDCGRRIAWRRDPEIYEWPEIMPYLHTKDNLIESNELFRTGEILADGAVINISGCGHGNVVRRNSIHHILNDRLSSVIRLDDFQRHVLIEENVIYRCNCKGLCNNGGGDNIWVNNVVIDVTSGFFYWFTNRPVHGSKITKNIFVNTYRERSVREIGGGNDYYAVDYRTLPEEDRDLYKFLQRMKNVEIDGNVYYNTVLPSGNPAYETLVKMRDIGHEKHSIFIDPLFVDMRGDDLRLREDSPALKMGIKSVDLSHVGLLKN